MYGALLPQMLVAMGIHQLNFRRYDHMTLLCLTFLFFPWV
jgi:hypothetical protein